MVTTQEDGRVRLNMEDRIMKKGAIIGIITGAVVLNIAAFSLFGSYLSSAKSASTEIRTHNDGVAVSENVYYDLGSNNKGVTANMDFAAEAEFADEVAFTSGMTNSPITASPDDPGVNVDPSQGRLLIRTVCITAETTNYNQVAADLESRVRECGGYIEYSSMHGTGNNKDLRSGSYTVRVPADKLDSLIAAVGSSCTVTASNENTTDVTLEYVDTKARIESLRVEYDQLLNLLAQAEDLDTIIVLQNRLTDVRYQIESAESRVRVLENQVEYATLTLTLNEVLEEKEVEEPHVVTYSEKVSNQFKETWKNTVEFFQNALLGLIASIPGIVVMIFIGVIVLIVVLVVRKKRRARIAKAKALAAKETEKIEEKKSEEKKSEDKKETKEDKKEEKKESEKD